MLQTIQLIAIIQGLFLLILLFKNRKNYIYTRYFYLFAALLSLILFLLGDDNSNLIISNSDFFLVDNTLFIVFLFLFLKNFTIQKPIQLSKIIPYFIPVVWYIFIELYEIYIGETYQIEVIEHLIYFIFVIYLAFSFYYTMRLAVKGFIKIPFCLLILSLFIDYSFSIFSFLNENDNLEYINTLFIFEIALIFYYLTYLFVFDDTFIKVPINTNKYKNSSLNEQDIQEYIRTIKEVMQNEKIYLNPDLTLQIFSEKTAIPKHYISEILNIHLNKTFTQFVNEYRIEAFINLYKNDTNAQYSILGLATTVGFKNKATFNSTFKKITGFSPSEYKKEVFNN